MAVSIDAQAAINEIARDLDRGVGRSRDDVSPIGFYGEHETYGTQADWLTGEGLTSAWGSDPGWGIRSTYSNPVSEYVAEDPTLNTFFIDAGGMLKREEKPGPEHYAALALSMVPVIGPAAVRAVTPLALATKKSIQDWGKRVHRNVDFNIDQPMTATSDATWKATGFRETLQGKILEKLGMLPEYKDLVKMQKNADPMIQGWYDDYVLKGKPMKETLSKAVDDLSYDHYERTMRGRGETPLSRSEWDLQPGPQTKNQMLESMSPQPKVLELSADEYYAMNAKMQGRLLDTSGLSKKDLDVYHWISEARDMQVAMLQLSRELGEGADSPLSREIALSIKEKDLAVFEAQLDTKAEVFNALERLHSDKFAEFVQRGYDYSLSQMETMETNLTNPLLTATKSDSLPKNVTQLPGTKPIQDMTWREWDDLSDSPFTLSSKQNEMMKAQGITKADDVLDHFWGKGARKDFEGWLLDAKAKQRLSDEAFQSKYAEELEFMRERDLKSGYMDAIPDDELTTDMAWKFLGEEFDQGFAKFGKNPLAVAQKMAWKPDNVSHEHWAQFTEKMTMKEVENAYRRLTLTLID